MRRNPKVVGWAALAAGAVAGIMVTAELSSARADESKVLVFAAASLKNALDKVNAACEAEVGELATISFAATSALAKQIEEGAPADVFFSADLDWMQVLSDKQLIKIDTRVELLANEIVVVVASGSPRTTTTGADFNLANLIGDGKLAMANVASVPAGKYGKAALETLGVWDEVKEQVVQAENVRAALALVAIGEAEAGIVYATDAKAEPRVTVAGTIPAESHPPIVYPVAQTIASQDEDTAAFLACLASPKAAAIFSGEGFTVIAK